MKLSELEKGEHYGYKSQGMTRRYVFLGFFTVARGEAGWVADMPEDFDRGKGHGVVDGGYRVYHQGQWRHSFAAKRRPVFASIGRDSEREAYSLTFFDSGHGLKPWAECVEEAEAGAWLYWRRAFAHRLRVPDCALVKDEGLLLPFDAVDSSSLRLGSGTEVLQVEELVRPVGMSNDNERVVVEGCETGGEFHVLAHHLVPYVTIERLREYDLRHATKGWRQRATDLLNAIARHNGEDGSPCSVETKQVTLSHSVLESLLTASEGSENAIAETLDVLAILRDERERVANG